MIEPTPEQIATFLEYVTCHDPTTVLRAVLNVAVQDAPPPREFDAVLAELARAMRKFPTWPTDPLHAVAVVGEEAGELTKAVLQAVYEPHKSAPDDVRAEAIQTAAMALRFLASMDRYVYQRGEQHKQVAAPAPADAPPPSEQEIARLRELEHHVWHMLDDSCENVDKERIEISLPNEDYDRVCELLGDEHPAPAVAGAPRTTVSLDAAADLVTWLREKAKLVHGDERDRFHLAANMLTELYEPSVAATLAAVADAPPPQQNVTTESGVEGHAGYRGVWETGTRFKSATGDRKLLGEAPVGSAIAEKQRIGTPSVCLAGIKAGLSTPTAAPQEDAPLTRVREAESAMGELAMMLMQDDREGAKDWARGVKVTFPDGAPRVPILTLEQARELDAMRAALAEKDAALRELREASHAYATIVLPSQGEAELEWTRFCAALRRADAALGSEKGATE